MHRAVLPDDKAAQNLTDGDAVAVGKAGFGVFQIERAFQCDAV